MSRRKVLYIVHNHPDVRPGGAEKHALELYEGMKEAGHFEPVLLAKSGPPMAKIPPPADGRLIYRANPDPNQYLFYTIGSRYNFFYGTPANHNGAVEAFADFLQAQQPDIVHFQHTLFLGYDMIRQVKQTLPNARILMTLHEYLPICHRQGQMLRTNDVEQCLEATPDRCHKCFPDIPPEAFFLRKIFIQSHLALIDQFLAPSRFLLDRFVDWGLPREKILFEEYGREAIAPVPTTTETQRRNRIGFFGQFTPFKGVTTLLKAAGLLAQEKADFHVWLHGANLELQPLPFRNTFNALVESAGPSVTLAGQYAAPDVTRLMAGVDWVVVPSIWWENSPLVIQEAFLNRRPVICSNLGGMAEKVAHDVNGLHFAAGDPASLAATLRTAADTPELWARLQAGIQPVYSMADSVKRIAGIYEELLQ